MLLLKFLSSMLSICKVQILLIFTGYPTSGPRAIPEQYDLAKPVYFDVDPLLVEGRQWRYPYIPSYPAAFRRNEGRETGIKTKTEVRSEDVNALVPGIFSSLDLSLVSSQPFHP